LRNSTAFTTTQHRGFKGEIERERFSGWGPSVADDILEAEVQVSGVAAATTQNVDTHASSSSFVAASAIKTEPEASLLIPLPTQNFRSLIRIGKRECKPSQRAHESNLMSE